MSKYKRYNKSKTGRIGKAFPSPSLMPRGNGKQSSRERHRDRVESSRRTVGVRSIQRMIASGARLPDYRHRGLEREDPAGLGAVTRAARRADNRRGEKAATITRCLVLDAHRRRKREQAIVRAMFRDVLRLSLHDEIAGGADV